MKLILMQRVEKLGKLGDVVTVKRGFGLNFLLPKGLAMRATEENIKSFETQKSQLEALNLKHKEEAEVLADSIRDKMVVLIRQAGESGQLYGSVSAKDIADELNNDHVKRQQIRIEHPIKEIGVHPVRVQLHPDVYSTLLVNVAKSEDEAKAQTESAEETVAESAAQPVD